jgi:hypothetical protein
VGGLFFIGAMAALFVARKRGYLNLKEMEDVKYRMMDE